MYMGPLQYLTTHSLNLLRSVLPVLSLLVPQNTQLRVSLNFKVLQMKIKIIYILFFISKEDCYERAIVAQDETAVQHDPNILSRTVDQTWEVAVSI